MQQKNIAPMWRQRTAVVVHIKYAKTTKKVNYNRNADAVLTTGLPAEAIQEATGQANRMKWQMLVFLFVTSLLQTVCLPEIIKIILCELCVFVLGLPLNICCV